jgi:hypothetical protein
LEIGISERIEIFLHAILPRLIREQDHATHETLELEAVALAAGDALAVNPGEEAKNKTTRSDADFINK